MTLGKIRASGTAASAQVRAGKPRDGGWGSQMGTSGTNVSSVVWAS